ncbi:DUF1648 domain-containing protein [Antribacter gilvus]|uniref:DUF1648 domain-containing protein n=1 Tax=Antribacter gilvus TaxID=2304675 RepID=UPI000F79D4F2|nr:DUF1648 domain-containing protein [Antribacter gilvus]
MTHTLADVWKPRARRVTAWSALAGLAILLAGLAIALSWRAELPDQVASHWGPGGAPDEFMPVEAFAGVMLGTGALCIAVLGAIGLLLGRSASTLRLAAGLTVWISGMLSAMTLISLSAQRGLADAAQTPFSGSDLVLAMLVPAVPGVVAALLVPRDRAVPAEAAVPADALRLGLSQDERAVWFARATGGSGLVVGGGAIALTTVIAVVTGTWALLAVPALLLPATVATFVFVVRVDTEGLTVRSALGWPGTHVPADEVVRADVVDVHPLRQFGGWGWRVGLAGQVGVVLRGGQGLRVEQTGGRSLVVTVDDARDAAALLNTMAERARTPGR